MSVQYYSTPLEQYKDMFDHLSIERLIIKQRELKKFDNNNQSGWYKWQIDYIQAILDKATAETDEIFQQRNDEELEELAEDRRIEFIHWF